MKVPDNHDTSIDMLLQEASSSIFLSDWNKSIETASLDKSLINNAVREIGTGISEYFFLDETAELKTWLSSSFKNYLVKIIPPQFYAISTNGTATVFLVLHVLNTRNRLSAIILTPIYFTYIKLLNDFSASIEYLQVVKDGQFSLDLEELELLIQTCKANIIIINDPIFGSGIHVDTTVYDGLLALCRKYKIYLLIDYIYGGMEWTRKPEVVNKNLVKMFIDHNEVIIIESISKRIFLNGEKTSLVFASPDIIKMFEKSSVHTIGCMTCLQSVLFKQLYDPVNRECIVNAIQKNINIACVNYELLKSVVLGTPLLLSQCDSGYFCLLYIPYSICMGNDNSLIALNLIKEKGILTIPHDRYLHFSETHYCFRINLTLPTEQLMLAISRILDSN